MRCFCSWYARTAASPGAIVRSAAFIEDIATSSVGTSPLATAPSIAAPRSTASFSRGSTMRAPVASACSRRNTGFFVSPPHAIIVSMR